MSEETERLHAEAMALQDNEAFSLIMAELSAAARDALVSTPAEQTDRIRDHQAMARAIEQIRERAKVLALTTAPKPKAGLA